MTQRFSRLTNRSHTQAAHANNQGFTLIEVMVAVLLLFAALAGILPFFLTGLSQASTDRYRSIANNVARERMEEIRQLDYREITMDSDEGATLPERFGTTANQRGIDFTVDYNVDSPTYEQGTLKKVTVTVSWTAPPEVSAASMTTLIHQQFLGPRGALLELLPTYDDPFGTPFSWIKSSTQAKYHLAEADWGLVFGDITRPADTVLPVYVRFAFFNDDGGSVALGDHEDDCRIGTDYLDWRFDDEGALDDVWFAYDFDAGDIPDGYWELRAVAYNQYEQPGNVWRLRVLIENGAPAAPTDFVAVPESDNETITLYWLGGPELDRDHYILERCKWDPVAGNWTAWDPVSESIGPKQVSYVDHGSVTDEEDPWGDTDTQNTYNYRIWAVDKCDPGLEGPTAELEEPVVLPPLTTTTTTETTTSSTSTTTPPSTTPTTAPSTYSVGITNNSKDNYDVVIKDSSQHTVYSQKVHKGDSVTVPNLGPGDYQVYADPDGQGSQVTQSFSLPAQAGQTILTLM
ncbi:MAG: prepilin-type N-terminal cleavage/methylation domain-containing protein [Actinomycetia bacterium]|nr:prepilin-type N-terminal cleavage/methylation domain-containing protein [Actinomycetes bacterium]